MNEEGEEAMNEIEKLNEIGAAHSRAWGAVDGHEEELERQVCRMREALLAFVRWYAVDSTEDNRDTAYDLAVKALASVQECRHEGCQCEECQITTHLSSCAVHNMPALPKGECDCGAVIVCSGCGGEINPDYGKCRRCG